MARRRSGPTLVSQAGGLGGRSPLSPGQEVAAAWQEHGQRCPFGQHHPAEVSEPTAR